MSKFILREKRNRNKFLNIYYVSNFTYVFELNFYNKVERKKKSCKNILKKWRHWNSNTRASVSSYISFQIFHSKSTTDKWFKPLGSLNRQLKVITCLTDFSPNQLTLLWKIVQWQLCLVWFTYCVQNLCVKLLFTKSWL